LIVPAIPKEVFTIGDFAVTKSILITAASYSMKKKIKKLMLLTTKKNKNLIIH
jgi:hypothetical protein